MGTEILKGPYIYTYIHMGHSNSAFTFNPLIGLLKFLQGFFFLCMYYLHGPYRIPTTKGISLPEVILVWSLGLGLIGLRVDDPVGCILWFYPHGYILYFKNIFSSKSTCLNEMHIQGYGTFKIDTLFKTLWIYVRNIHTHHCQKCFGVWVKKVRGIFGKPSTSKDLMKVIP